VWTALRELTNVTLSTAPDHIDEDAMHTHCFTTEQALYRYRRGTPQIICKEKQRPADPTDKCSHRAAHPTSSIPGQTWLGSGTDIAITDRLRLDQDQRHV